MFCVNALYKCNLSSCPHDNTYPTQSQISTNIILLIVCTGSFGINGRVSRHYIIVMFLILQFEIPIRIVITTFKYAYSVLFSPIYLLTVKAIYY